MKNNCLIYPILQKYYNALNNLRELNINDDIFLNISKIDAFFAEFRNITFVMQKCFNTPELKEYYQTKRAELLLKDNMKWFVDKRNKVTKEQSFKLEKGIIVEVYFTAKSMTLVDDRLTIDNEISFESICVVLKEILSHFKNCYDVFFSISLSFKENGNEVDIYPVIKEGIITMNNFISAVVNDFPCSCEKCTRIKKEIQNCFTDVLVKEFMFNWDCSLENGEIVFGSMATMLMGGKNAEILPMEEIRTPLKGNFLAPEDGKIITCFEKFTVMHLFCYKTQNLSIMPTFMVIFDDFTFSLISFEATIKTTFYRMASKIAKIAREKNAIAVFFVGEYYFYSVDKIDQLQCNYEERIKKAEKTMFCTIMTSKDSPSIMSINIDSAEIENDAYVAKQINSPDEIESFHWFQPIHDSLHKK